MHVLDLINARDGTGQDRRAYTVVTWLFSICVVFEINADFVGQLWKFHGESFVLLTFLLSCII